MAPLLPLGGQSETRTYQAGGVGEGAGDGTGVAIAQRGAGASGEQRHGGHGTRQPGTLSCSTHRGIASCSGRWGG